MRHFRVDGKFYGHPKVAGLPIGAVGLWALAGSWSVQYRTDGNVPDVIVEDLLAGESYTSALVDAGLWARTDEGWRFVNWRKWQDGDYRRNISVKVRRRVFERDVHACVECGATEALSLDHIIRYRDGGPDSVDNLRVLCMPCNIRRG